MNILLCGATGFVGRALMRALQAEGHHVLPGVSHARGLSDEVVASTPSSMQWASCVIRPADPFNPFMRSPP